MSFLGEITASGVGALMGGVGTLAKDIREAITGDLPAEKRAEIEMKLKEIESASLLGQLKINEIEAASESVWVAGWRPFIGWISGTAVAYNYVLMPLLAWTAKCFYPDAPPMISLDTSELFTLLAGMLGIGAMRSFDKKQAPNPAGKE